MKYVSNPPDAAALMTSARSFGNYDLAGALADLIDNSIKAGATQVALTCLFNDGDPEVRVLDNGHGMSREELVRAMRPASTNPQEERSPDDLGRFGWGLKSASFSQCRRLTVISRQKGVLTGTRWDLDDIDQWRMGILSARELKVVCSEQLHERDGAEIIWTKCDRLSENGTLRQTGFNDLITLARRRIGLIFHRYISGGVRGRPLRVELNGVPIAEYDPFYRKHDATQQLEEETLRVSGARVVIRPYILPHHSKLRSSELERLAGEEGLARNQGFYVYRNHRLIMYGTWFRLLRHGELSQLVRVSIDIPNSLDSIWKITVDKSDAQLPAVLRNRLRQIVEGLKTRSARVHRSKGGRLDSPGTVSVWSRFARKGEIRYYINRDHPLIATLFATVGDDRTGLADAVLRVIEQGFPVSHLSADASQDIEAIHQTEADPFAFRDFLSATLPLLLTEQEGNVEALIKRLKQTEPYCTHWTAVEDFLVREKWIHA
ncbi:ATP-binding protein [Azospirillum brasilense]|uniref:ATP-binding protein n=1 Tax=Azospirillum brasilense TaxID=192 RepID=A0A6L3AT81_AZOBR|nr:ATP-binding protein [Azospirillum brasilense]KAA0678173.1 ATP-binding protein [Azospirillum brasilense]